ncbi:hypothetical protein, partial [Flavobacterium sp.]|uniref:beta strand repeat-containing protein n=1 Tax=Flavobacterium sp. TaxID=239 RepID=UPI002637A8A6
MKKIFTKISLTVGLSLALNIVHAQAVPGDSDLTFNTIDTGSGKGDGGNTGAINTMAYQPDGKIIVGGTFSTFNGTSATRITRLNADGTSDLTFNPGGTGFNSTVNAIARQADGKIVIGGNFATYNGTTVARIVRINADGTIDTTFNVGGAGASGNVYAIAIQTDGKILVGGDFTTYNSVTANRIIRLNTDGSKDSTFTGAALSGVRAITIQPSDSKILMGYIDGSNNGISRLNTDGSVDSTFSSGTGTITGGFSIAVQSDGKIILGEGSSSTSSTGTKRIYRLNTNGSVDTNYTSGVGTGHHTSIVIQPDGKIIFGGTLALGTSATTRYTLTRLNADFTFDNTFNVGGSGVNSNTTLSNVNALLLRSDGKILIGGAFTFYNGKGVNRIAQLNSDGSLDSTFNAGTGINLSNLAAVVSASAIQSDGKIIVGGSFRNYNSTLVNYLARINADGSLDTTFNSGGSGINNTMINTTITAIAIQGDGKIVIGGNNFTSYNGTTVGNLARLNTNGTLDTAFNTGGAGSTGAVGSIAIQSDGKILIGGALANYNGTSVNRIIRLLSNGTQDNTFMSSITGIVNAIAIQTDGKILVGGAFSSRISRLLSTGVSDPTFNTGAVNPNSTVNTVALQTDGKIVIGGLFTAIGTTTIGGIARLTSAGAVDTTFISGGAGATVTAIAFQSDGKIIVGGNFTVLNGTAANRLIRLDANGYPDTTFTYGNGADAAINTLAIQADGRIIAGGNFINYNGVGKNRLARIFPYKFTYLPTASPQTYCAGAMVSDLTATGTAPLWYTAPTGGTALTATTVLATGTYYVSQTINSVESARISVAVTINPSTDNITTVSVCDSYTWTNNGQTYTTSGTYSGTSTNCVTEKLVLTITPSSIHNNTISACDAYTWANNGQTYTTSGTYTGTTTNCVTEELVLTIATSSINVTNVASCGNYFWANNGQTYTVSGLYTGNTVNCIMEKLNLVIENTTWDGNNWNNGLPTAFKGVIINGDYSEAIDLAACSLSIGDNAVVVVPSGYNFTVSGKVTVAPTASLTFENNSNLIQADDVINEGNIVYKRNASMRRLDYTYWSAPVSRADFTLKSFSPQTVSPPFGTSRFYEMNESSNSFGSIDPLLTYFDANNIAKGFCIRAPNDFNLAGNLQTFNGVFMGVPNNGNITVPTSYSGAGKGYNLIGNPYPSPINALQFLQTAGNAGTIYLWTHTAQGAVTGSNYAMINLTGSTKATATLPNSTTYFSATPNGTIQSGQGFVLGRLNGNSPVATFNNSQRTANNDGQFFRTATTEPDRFWLNLTGSDAANQILIGYIENATNGLDESIDGRLLYGDSAIASLAGGESLGI